VLIGNASRCYKAKNMPLHQTAVSIGTYKLSGALFPFSGFILRKVAHLRIRLPAQRRPLAPCLPNLCL
jgi:hypothetical protein